MRFLFSVAIALLLLLAPVKLNAVEDFSVRAGSSAHAIQAIVNRAVRALGAVTITFAPGSYDIRSTILLACPIGGDMIIRGAIPLLSYPGPYTTLLTGPVPGGWAFTAANGCAHTITVEFFDWDGKDPKEGGGGFIYVPQGTSNLVIQFNRFRGNQTVASEAMSAASTMIWMGGSEADPTSNDDIVIRWNQFGAPGDCSAVMNLFYYYGPKRGRYDEVGGDCAALGVQVPTNHLRVLNNSIEHQEQGFKWYEPVAPGRRFHQADTLVANNHFRYIHLTGIDMRSDPAPVMTFRDNDYEDPENPGFGSHGILVTGQAGEVNITGNVLIDNTDPAPSAIEFKGRGTVSNNLVQGRWDNMKQKN